MNSSLGIYFGPGVISIVETKGKMVLNNAEIPYSVLLPGEQLEEKVPEDLKIVTMLKDELSKNKITTKEATVGLSGKDLVVRTFEMLVLPREELVGAVSFEAKKYIPFKIEDLISDFQITYDRASRKNLILFMGIKKEILNKYLAILEKLDIKVNTIEYSAFSVLRLMQLMRFAQQGIIGVISVDFPTKDEVNFLVLENGFPLFSRDITLIGGPEEFFKTESPDTVAILEKLKTEIRISLDFYHRKFPTKNIAKTFFVSSPELRSDLTTFIIKDMDLSIQFIDVSKVIGRPIPFSLSFIKGYSASLSKMIKTDLKIDLVASKIALIPKAGLEKEAALFLGRFRWLAGLKISRKVLTLSLLICVAVFIQGLYKMMFLQKELENIRGLQPEVLTVNPKTDYQELTKIDSEYKKKIDTMDKFIRHQLYLTDQLDAIPRVMPENMWLTDFSFTRKEDTVDLILRGIVYLGDNNRELELLNLFISRLKENTVLGKHFKEITIDSVDNIHLEKITATQFTIVCRAD
jgi:hypothetical protein